MAIFLPPMPTFALGLTQNPLYFFGSMPTPRKNNTPPPVKVANKAPLPWRWQTASICLWAFLLYANTLSHGFVLDDGLVILENKFVQAGLKGIPDILSHDTFFGYAQAEGQEQVVAGGRYRPLSLVLFAVLHQFFGNTAFMFHLATVLLFVATCLVLYHSLSRLLAPITPDAARTTAWIATLLFAAHPVHTEVVANIKSCDEILALLGGLLALNYVCKAQDTGRKAWAIWGGVAFLLACLAKENAVAFAAVIPVAWWIRRGSASENLTLGRVMAPVALALGVFLAVRGALVGWSFKTPPELLNNPYLKLVGGQWVPFSLAEKMGTVCYGLGQYLRLLVWPFPLTHDYYPNHISLTALSNPVALLGLIAHLGLGFYAILGLGKRDVLRFSALYYLLTLFMVSNVLFPIGTHLGERFLFMPSVGFCLALGFGLNLLLGSQAHRKFGWGLLAGLLVVWAVLTFRRNAVWANNEVLFTTDVRISQNSAPLNKSVAGILLSKALKMPDGPQKQTVLEDCMRYADKALSVYPDFAEAYGIRGTARYYFKQYEAAIADYRAAARFNVAQPEHQKHLAMALREAAQYHGEQKNDLATAQRYLLESWQLSNQDPETARLLGVVYMLQRNYPEAIRWYNAALQLAPNTPDYVQGLANVYLLAGDRAKAEALLNN